MAKKLAIKSTSPVFWEKFETFAERMELIAKLAGGLARLEQTTGVSRTSFRNYLGDGEPSRRVLAALHDVFRFEPRWMTLGSGPIRDVSFDTQNTIAEIYLRYCGSRHLSDGTSARMEFVQSYNDGVVVRHPELPAIALVELRQWLDKYTDQSALQSEFVIPPCFDPDEVESLAMSPEALTAALRAAPFSFHGSLVVDRWKLDRGKLYLFNVRTNDVAPELRPGYWVLCDGQKQAQWRDGIYALRQNDQTVFRHVRFLDRGKIQLRWKLQEGDSDARDHTEHVTTKDVEIIGRAIWFSGRLGR